MRKTRILHYIVSVVMLASLLSSLMIAPAVFAQEGEDDNFEMFSRFPEIEGRSGDEFQFEVKLRWKGESNRNFDLELIEDLPDWEGEITAGYPEKRVFAIGLEPSQTIAETINVKLRPLTGVLPDPGDYSCTVQATSGDISESVDLTAVVVAKYLFAFYTETGRLNTEVTAGKENHFGLRVQNTGSTPVTDIDFLVAKPEGWVIEYDPDNVDKIEPGYRRDIDLIITPPREVVPGDYMLELQTVAKEVGKRTINLRVTVLTPTVWGWVGVIIVVLVIAGLIFMFRQLGRR
jgi:uncharacterized membrane protein